jgi:SsrA-binding protein
LNHRDLVSNRKALHNYQIIETFEAGIVLLGTEIQSLRHHQGSLQEAYVTFKDTSLHLVQASIPPYRFGNLYNHEEKRGRKLLLHKREIETIKQALTERGLAVIPLAIYLNQKGFAKVKIAIAKGKKLYDKRAHLKAKESALEMKRALKARSN